MSGLIWASDSGDGGDGPVAGAVAPVKELPGDKALALPISATPATLYARETSRDLLRDKATLWPVDEQPVPPPQKAIFIGGHAKAFGATGVQFLDAGSPSFGAACRSGLARHGQRRRRRFAIFRRLSYPRATAPLIAFTLRPPYRGTV